jgi:tripartite-type tricarboxylate transporter receptor subunit TctC
MVKKIFVNLSVLLACLISAPALAAYPDRYITIVVPYPAGGPSDKIARDLIDAMRKPLGVDIVIDYVGGAGGTVGQNKVAKAKNDGYTILLSHLTLATSPALYKHLPYDTLNDFEYLGLFSEVPMALVGRPNLPATTMVDLVRWMAKSPNAVNFANSGIGSASHLCALLIQQYTKLKTTGIPYKGTGPAMIDLMGGQVDVMCDQTTNSSPQIAAGKVKPFAITSAHRINNPVLRNLPTLRESSMDIDIGVWHGLYAPKGTPPEVLKRLNAALLTAVGSAEFSARQSAVGAEVIRDARNNPSEHKKFVQAEIIKWDAMIKAVGQYAD